MNNNNTVRKYKIPKQKTQSTTNAEPPRHQRKDAEEDKPESLCPLAARDSEWLDILQSSSSDPVKSITNVSDEEEVECVDGPQMKPLAIMFPGLLEKDPTTLEGMLNKAMSTTEVTKHLVGLGQKANFTFMKKADRLIPPDKKWLESLTENSNSLSSMASALFSGSLTSDYDGDNKIAISNSNNSLERNKLKIRAKQANDINIESSIISSEDIFASIGQIIAEIIRDEILTNDRKEVPS